MKKALTVSIIIPAYNEERHLKACLDSIARQTVKPHEVIVVDNNSTDMTAEIATDYKFVKLLRQTKPGLIPTRNLGFDTATGQILGRVNADAVLDPSWVEVASLSFVAEEVEGVTGPALTKVLPSTELFCSTIWSMMYFQTSRIFFGTSVMWGANMAILSTTWQAIRADAHQEDTSVHEDQDLSLLITARGSKILVQPQLLIKTSEQSYFYLPKFIEYVRRSGRTKRLHKPNGYLNTPYRMSPLKRLVFFIIDAAPSLIFITASILCYPVFWVYARLNRSVRYLASLDV